MELSSFFEKAASFKEKAGSVLSKVLPSFIGDSLGPTEKKEFDEKAEKVATEARSERASLLGEFFESFLARQFPSISKGMDLLSTVGVADRDTEIFPWQNEFETLTALTLFVPDAMLKRVTDPLVDSKYFLMIVAAMNEKLAKKIKKERNPDDVISALREIHQHLSLSKASIERVTE